MRGADAAKGVRSTVSGAAARQALLSSVCERATTRPRRSTHEGSPARARGRTLPVEPDESSPPPCQLHNTNS